MKFTNTSLSNCVVVELERHSDDRGFFARTWCGREFSEAGLPSDIVQSSMSRNRKRGTIRGLHFQLPPSREGKLVRCARGAIYDVAVDVRPGSESFLEHVAVRLTAENSKALYVPPGCAHGFQVLEDYTDVMYQMTDHYAPELSAGLRWNDPLFRIDWPIDGPSMNERDSRYDDADVDWLRSLTWV